MTPQLVDHAHTGSYIVIGCNLVQPRRKNEHAYFWSQSHRSHNCEQLFRGVCQRRSYKFPVELNELGSSRP